MLLLVCGVLLFCGVHLIPSLAPSMRRRWQDQLGFNGYRGSFSLLLLAALVLIVTGWGVTTPVTLYLPSPALHHGAMSLLSVAFLLLVVSFRPSRLRRAIRHPQLTGVLLWGIAHLLLNGDSRSLLLFGGLAVWAIVEMIAINRRDGPRAIPTPPSWGTEAVTLLLTAAAILLAVVAHPWFTGMPVTW